MAVSVLYFAALREQLGLDQEEVFLAASITLAEFVSLLKTRSEAHREVFSDLENIRAAINAEFAHWDASVAPQDEVAFFPPVTGGIHV